MKENTEVSNNGAEIYTSKIFSLTDRYIEERLDGSTENISANFRDLIFYLADRLELPDHGDIESLDKIFNGFTRLCARYQRLPTLEAFSWLVKINRSTFTDWGNKEYRSSSEHGNTVKKWFNICKGFTVDELSNSKYPNPNLIFTAKAAYGMRETSPVPAIEQPERPILTAAELPKLLSVEDEE